jgi:hypothetical protein
MRNRAGRNLLDNAGFDRFVGQFARGSVLTGRSADTGVSQASAMMRMNCSKVKVAGAPGRCSSLKRTSIA